MNTFSKVATIGLLLVTLPAIARCDERPQGAKCIEGVFVGITMASNFHEFRPFTFQFNKDKTMIIQFAEGPGANADNPSTQHEILGTWKCLGDNCFSFCAAESLIADLNIESHVQFIRYVGTICFTDDACNTAQITNFSATEFADPKAQLPSTALPAVPINNFSVYRLICK